MTERNPTDRLPQIPRGCFLEYGGPGDAMRAEYYRPSQTVPVIDFVTPGMPDYHPLITIQGLDSKRVLRVPRRDVKVLTL